MIANQQQNKKEKEENAYGSVNALQGQEMIQGVMVY